MQLRKLLHILTYPEDKDVLKAENKEVYLPDIKKYFEFVQDMIYTMKRNRGIGLAAPQVGKNINLLIATIDKKPVVFFNSRIKAFSEEKIMFHESCLSCPNVIVSVPRSREIEVEYRDFKGRHVYSIFKDFNAIVFQHEYDHILGKLLVDYEEESKQDEPDLLQNT